MFISHLVSLRLGVQKLFVARNPFNCKIYLVHIYFMNRIQLYKYEAHYLNLCNYIQAIYYIHSQYTFLKFLIFYPNNTRLW